MSRAKLTSAVLNVSLAAISGQQGDLRAAKADLLECVDAILEDAIRRGFVQGFMDGTEYAGEARFEAQMATAEGRANKFAKFLTTWLRNEPTEADLVKAREQLNRPEVQAAIEILNHESDATLSVRDNESAKEKE